MIACALHLTIFEQPLKKGTLVFCNEYHVMNPKGVVVLIVDDT